jgi:hypothetical protein
VPQENETVTGTNIDTRAPTWTHRQVKLRDLRPWERNPRKINAQQSARLLDSFDSFGQVDAIAIGPNLDVYNGHQRLKVLRERYGDDFEIEARVCSRELTEKEREKLTIYLHRGATGDFDLEQLLSDWNPVELDAWGLPDLNLPDLADDEWQGMPEFDGSPKQRMQLVVRFADEHAIDAFAALVGQPVTRETISIWYPAQPPRDLTKQQWVTDEGYSQDVACAEPVDEVAP